MRFEIEMILLLSLFSPLVEIFPNLYMSWWVPSNGKLQRYLDTWLRRVAAVLIVWIPILIILAKIINPSELILVIGTLVFLAFGLRLYFFDRSLKQESSTKPSRVPELLYFVAFSSIGLVLYTAVPNNNWLVPLGILMIFFGAFMIGTFRQGEHTNLRWDVVGRIIFTVGFLINLYNLFRAASVVVLG